MPEEVTVVTFGESVAWGQGLSHDQKVPSIIHDELSDRPCGPLERTLIKARSGAVIEGAAEPPLDRDINRWGRHEVPHGSPTITDQVASYPEADDPDPEAVDVVVLVGGINDVGVNTILDPGTGSLTLRRDTERNLYESIVELLDRILEKFTDAKVFVGGYFPLFTGRSEPPPLEAFEEALGIEELTPGDYPFVGTVWNRIVRNAEFFHRYQLWMLTRAVADVNDGIRDAPVTFVHPGLSPENAIWGDRTMIFGPMDDDPARNVRVPACHRVYDSDAPGSSALLEILFDSDLVRCRVASTGHPNPDGARRYADTALRRQEQERITSLRALLTEVLGASGDPLKTRDTIERYGFDPADGIRSLVKFAELDCLAARIDSEVVAIELGLQELPDVIRNLPLFSLRDFIRDLDSEWTLLELDLDDDFAKFAVHAWVDNDALATLEADLDDGRTITRPFDSRGYDLVDSSATSSVFDPIPGSSRTDVAILDPTFDRPRERLPLGAINDLRIRMADFERQAFERVIEPILGSLSVPDDVIGLIDVDAFVSAVWQINGAHVDVDGRRVFVDYGGRTIETDEVWNLDYPS